MMRRTTARLLVLGMMASAIVLGACGDDDDPVADSGGDPTETADDAADDTTESPTGSNEGEKEPDAGGDGGEPVGTATVDGTTYTLVADLQCLVAVDEVNQISISGSVEENPSDAPYEFTYSWDSDDDVNEFSLDVSDDLEYTTFSGIAEFGEPQVEGQSVTASGMLQPKLGDPVEASFEIDCAA